MIDPRELPQFKRLMGISEKNVQTKKRARDPKADPAPIIFLSIAAACFLAFVGIFAYHTVRMRHYESDYEKMYGTVTDYAYWHGADYNTAYHYVISYTFEGNEYRFTDLDGYDYYTVLDNIGKYIEIYVDPKSPSDAQTLSAADNFSAVSVVTFGFFCVLYAVGMCILLAQKGSFFLKRFLFVWGTEISLCMAILLLFWLGLPGSDFSKIFTRIGGAIGILVVSGLVLLAVAVDGIITYKLRAYRSQ